VGGGLAGSVAAYHLARSGLRTVLLEKEKEPHHKVCGEFVSAEGIPVLEAMGVELSALGAVPLRQFRLHGPHRSCETRLPQAAMGISRKVLDRELLRIAAQAGAEIRRGVMVKERLEGLEGPSGSIILETSEGEIRAQRLVLATGKAEFRSIHRREGRDSGLVGFKMHLKLKPSAAKELRSHCDLFVFENGYGGIAEIENGLANFCFLIEKSALPVIGADWESLASYIARKNWGASRYLDGAEPQFRNFVTVAHVPYGFLRKETPEMGVYCVGDQMAVIPSLTGDGMTIALRTGLAAAEAIIDPEHPGRMRPATTALDYQKAARLSLRPQVEAGFFLHRIFKNPRACDWAAMAIGVFPKVVDVLFGSTRCRIENPTLGGRHETQVKPQSKRMRRAPT
jgi:menaquinone-9 beta-reductase